MELENNVISYEDFCGKYAKEMNDVRKYNIAYGSKLKDPVRSDLILFVGSNLKDSDELSSIISDTLANKGNKKVVAIAQKEIDAEIHYSNQPIKIPRQIRNYFRGIDKYKKQDSEKYKYFRNACRLYNKSKVLGTDDASIEISFMVASIEALSKTEGDIGFTNFVMKYNSDATREELDSLYVAGHG